MAKAKRPQPGSTDFMLEEIRSAMARCRATEKETYEALVVEAEGWRMRLGFALKTPPA